MANVGDIHPELNEVNNIYLQIQDYMFPPFGYFEQLTTLEMAAWQAAQPEAHSLYHKALDRFHEIYPKLSPNEIITAYQHGSRILQANLSGRIARDFDVKYIPLMQWAIRSGHSHTGPIFLTALARYTGENATSLIIESLDNPEPSMRETALALVAELNLTDAVSQVRKCLNDPVRTVSSVAKRTLEALQRD